jgi:hypothetical protein
MQTAAGSSAPSAADVPNAAPSMQQDRSDMPPPVVVGDLNVQFPDSLVSRSYTPMSQTHQLMYHQLWKRRIVEIDEAGYLIFCAPQAMDVHKRAAKKYHISEFKLPYAPDLDRQELPHSVMLDFTDNQQTGLQAACEDAMTHRQVLFTLRGYWKAWAGVA